ncbi:hypothetical protein M0804_009674 [Polistes exclamans]|nr:hypothetical protein M0804_009674 [Polistes exclamans]
MRPKFHDIVKRLWFYYKCGFNINYTVRKTLVEGLFRHFESSFTSVEYWFWEFQKDLPYFNLLWMRLDHTNLRISFLKVLVRRLPSWKICYYMDALKSSRLQIYTDMENIGYVYCRKRAKWIKNTDKEKT